MAEARSRKAKGRTTGRKAATATTRSNRRSAAGQAAVTKRAQTAGGGRAGARKSAAQGSRAARKTTDSTRSRGGKSAAKRTTAARGTAGRKAARARGAAKGAAGRRSRMDALTLLKQDHQMVDEMFRKYDRMKQGDDRKSELRARILEEVRVHAQMEEEIFYPALEDAFQQGGKEAELIHEAHVEHDTIKWLMAQIESAQGDEEKTDACVKVMGEYIRHHVEEEEGQIFKAAKRAKVDVDELGRRLDARKRELKGEPPADAEEMAEGGLQVLEPAQMATPRTTY